MPSTPQYTKVNKGPHPNSVSPSVDESTAILVLSSVFYPFGCCHKGPKDPNYPTRPRSTTIQNFQIDQTSRYFRHRQLLGLSSPRHCRRRRPPLDQLGGWTTNSERRDVWRNTTARAPTQSDPKHVSRCRCCVVVVLFLLFLFLLGVPDDSTALNGSLLMTTRRGVRQRLSTRSMVDSSAPTVTATWVPCKRGAGKVVCANTSAT